MHNIIIASNTLNLRGGNVQRLLRHISHNSRQGPAYSHKPFRRRHVIGFHDGNPSSENYRDWRFKTKAPSIYAMYFEQWRSADAIRYDSWYLDRSYLNLYKLSDSRFLDELDEFICLHCDPNEPETVGQSIYKRVPHIHVKAAQEPIPHAHFSLNLNYSDKVLDSVDSLFSTLESAILMLRDEILERM